MLETLGFHEEKPHLIIIKDNVKQGGYPLFKAVLHYSLEKSSKVTLVLFELQVESLLSKEQLESHAQKGLHIQCPDVEEWFHTVSRGDQPSITAGPFDEFSEGSLFIDTLNPLLAVHSSSEVYRKLHKLLHNPKVRQIVILVHWDTHDEVHLAPLEHLSSLVVALSHPDPSYPLSIRAHITGRSTGKKLINRHESFTVLNDGRIQSMEIKSQSTDQTAPFQVDLSSLTFNVGIKEDEMAARKKLVLPYTEVMNSNTDSSVGEIFYQPDAVDDFDEEDPDNDLNI